MSFYLMGIDAGTTSFKGAIFDENRNAVVSYQIDYTLLTPAAEWVEYPAEEYWKRFTEIENVIGVKVAAFNRYATVDVVRAAAFSSPVRETQPPP